MGGPRHRLVATPDEVAPAVAGALRDVDEGAAVVVAVSGGPDSVVLAHVVAAARPDLRLTVVHVRHGLRTDDADDVAAAQAAASSIGADFVDRSVAVEGRGGIEADARAARYAALAEVARQRSSDWVLAGHTADDQAETVVLNIARGAGLRGASGMGATRALGQATLLRPLLEVRRAAVHALADRLRAGGTPIADDAMNHDPARRRNRARAEALPALARLTGESTDPVVALLRLARAAADDDEALEATAAEHADRLVHRWGPAWALPFLALTDLPVAVGVRILRRLAGPAAREPGATPRLPSSGALHDVLALRPGTSTELAPNVIAARSGRWLTIAPAEPPTFAPQAVGADIVELSVRVERVLDPTPGLLPFWAPPGAAPVVPAPVGELRVQPCRREDLIATAAGPRRLAAAVRAAVPAGVRALVLVVADDQGPVWAPGVAVRDPGQASSDGFLRIVATSGGA